MSPKTSPSSDDGPLAAGVPVADTVETQPSPSDHQLPSPTMPSTAAAVDRDLADLEAQLNALSSLGTEPKVEEPASDTAANDAMPEFTDSELDDIDSPTSNFNTMSLDELRRSTSEAVEPSSMPVTESLDTTLSPPTSGRTEEAAPAAEDGLRSQLAEMFGVEMSDLVASKTADESTPRVEAPATNAGDGPSVGSIAAQFGLSLSESDLAKPTSAPPLTQTQPLSSASTIDAAPASSDNLPDVAPAASEPEPVATSEPVSHDTAPVDESADDEDDSVAAYMERLLARSRGTKPSSPEPTTAVAKSEPPASATAGAPDKSVATLDPPPVVRRERRVRRPVSKEQMRQETDSLRALALASSRAAIAKSRRREMKMQLTSKLVVSGMSLLVSLVLLASPLWSRESFVLYGAIGILITAGFIFNFLRDVRRYRKAISDAAADEKAATDEIDRAAAAAAAFQNRPTTTDE